MQERREYDMHAKKYVRHTVDSRACERVWDALTKGRAQTPAECGRMHFFVSNGVSKTAR